MSLIVATQDEYEDLLGLWSDLESGLAMLLTCPASVQEFALRVRQYDRWMQDLLGLDTDVGLYLLFQLATNSLAGYSASHALVCAVLCDLIAADFDLPLAQRNSLVRAALTMNIAMTALQNEMARQTGRPSTQQQAVINLHPSHSVQLLQQRGIDDTLWLQTVQYHHRPIETPRGAFDTQEPAHQLAAILQVVDRYAAMISPRESREGRSAAASAQDILQGNVNQSSTIGQALVRMVGLSPPGTFVQLDDERIAIVTRRSKTVNQPDVTAVMQADGTLIRPPQLLSTEHKEPDIRAALLSSAVPERINHHLILRLGSALPTSAPPFTPPGDLQ
ncbi:MAG: phosphodiesterase [Rhodoferax sp.]|nr:phosphodiesterase [Rhodoferax sp.]